jgi:tRNA pseudouridine65 synthase
MVVAKPPSVLCHHSGWAGARARNKAKDNHEEPEIPMLQRVRRALNGRRVNVIHRLDRGCSGCLLFAYAETDDEDAGTHGKDQLTCRNYTAILSQAMSLESTVKTYVAVVRGSGILHGRDFKQEGWFEVCRPIKDEKGVVKNAKTLFRFVAGQASTEGDSSARASLVLARPLNGRWHQIRRHLNGLSHPVLGDSIHGNSKVNKEWKVQRGMPPERTCLHLARIQMEPTPACPTGIDVCAPLPADMMAMLTTHLPNVLSDAIPILEEEGIALEGSYRSGAKELPYELFAP